MLTAYLVDRARRDAETLLLCPQFGTLAGAARSAAFGGWPAAGFLSGARLCGGPLASSLQLANATYKYTYTLFTNINIIKSVFGPQKTKNIPLLIGAFSGDSRTAFSS